MIKLNSMLIGFLAIGLSACATIETYPVESTKTLQEYHLNQELIKSVGEPMVSVTHGYVLPGFVAKDDQSEEEGLQMLPAPPIHKGESWVAVRKTNDGAYICLRHERTLSEKKLLEEFYIACSVSQELPITIKEGKFIGLYYPSTIISIDSNVTFSPINIFLEGVIRQEVIYNGKSGSTIKFTYREYKDDLARPAFFQDLSYDLNESKTIGFKGMMINIIEATNSYIKYQIKSPMHMAS